MSVCLGVCLSAFCAQAKQKIIQNSFNGVLSGTVFHSGAYFLIMISFYKQTHIHTHAMLTALTSLWPHIVGEQSQSPFASTQKRLRECTAKSGWTVFRWMNENEQEAKESRSISDLLFLHSLLMALSSTFLSCTACLSFNRFNVIWLEGFPLFKFGQKVPIRDWEVRVIGDRPTDRWCSECSVKSFLSSHFLNHRRNFGAR